MKTRYQVETATLSGWVNCWTDDEEKPVTFATREEAEHELGQLLDDQLEAYRRGHMEGAYSSKDYRITEINPAPEGTHENPIRYERIHPDDPQRKEKLAAQREQFSKDAEAGKVLCLTDLFINAGM